ncbi:AAA family ATPase [Modestobacter sp. DSM 44400]|uniref:AAA family ATPase n=1 Tax=Modestobacter sp. DSM 44400 TaxID=1550230 RepID=UPI0011151155|nr:AAA family ATPase [Modestobacter sp. DSM 44400]
MILWLHGAFGAGKSAVAAELRRQRPDVVLFDPEEVGYLLQRTPPVPTGDFQDLPEWRELVVATAAALDADGRRLVLAPMTMLQEAYVRQIVDGLGTRGVRLHQVLLDVAADELVRRVLADASPEHGDAADEVRAWRLERVATYADARSWLVPMVDLVIDTTTLTPEEAATEVLVTVEQPSG